jgi:polyhydroxybutyrate depolymerase
VLAKINWIALTFFLSVQSITAAAFDWCGTTRISPGSSKVNYMIVNGVIRSYGLYVPVNTKQNIPLIVDFHGFGSNRIAQEISGCWNDVAEREGAIVAYPQGLGVVPAWNGGDFCCDSNNQNDSDFALQIARCLVGERFYSRNVIIDKARIYASGLSNGGAMAGKLACEHSDVFVGAVVTSQSFPFRYAAQCRTENGAGSRKPAFSIMEARGAIDVIVPYGFSWGWSVAAEASLDRWRTAQACQGEPIVEDICDRPGSGELCVYGKAHCKTYYDCEGGSIASQCMLSDGHLLYKNPHDFNVCNEAWVEFERFSVVQQ